MYERCGCDLRIFYFYQYIYTHTHIYIYERRVLWNSRKIWNTEVSALIGAAIS